MADLKQILNRPRYGFSQPPPDMANLLAQTQAWGRPDLQERLTQAGGGIPVAKANLSMMRQLLEEQGGVTPDRLQEVLAPAEPQDDRNFLQKVGDTLDFAGAPIRKYGAAPLLETLGAVPSGRLTGMDKVMGEDIVKALRGKSGEAEGDWIDTVGGLATDIVLDPITWVTTGTAGGMKLLGKAAPKTYKKLIDAGLVTISKEGKAVASLTRPGQREFQSFMSQKAKSAGLDYGNFIKNPDNVEGMMDEFMESIASGSRSTNLLDLGGIKMFGKTIPGLSGSEIRKYVGVMRQFKTIDRLATAVEPTVQRMNRFFNPPSLGLSHDIARAEYESTVQRYLMHVDPETGLGDGALPKVAKALSVKGFREKDWDVLPLIEEHMLSVEGLKDLPKGIKNIENFFDVNKSALKREISKYAKDNALDVDADATYQAMRNMRVLYEENMDLANSHGLAPEGWLPWFVSHLWENAGRDARKYPQSTNRALAGGGGLERYFKGGIEEAKKYAETLGLDLKFNANAADQYIAQRAAIGRAIATQQYIARLKKLGLSEKSGVYNVATSLTKGIDEADEILKDPEKFKYWSDKLVEEDPYTVNKKILKMAMDAGDGVVDDTKKSLSLLRQFIEDPQIAERMGWQHVKQPGLFKRMAMEADGQSMAQFGNKIFAGPTELIDSLEDIAKIDTRPELVKQIGTFWRRMTNMQKRFLTVLYPSFHIRNWYSDQFRAMFKAGLESFNPNSQGQAWNIVRGGVGDVITQTGDRIPFSQVRDWEMQYGLFNYAHHGRLDMAGTINDTVIDMLKGTGLNRYMKKIESGAGAFIQNHTNTLLFTSLLKKGYAPDQAAQETFKFLFNYNLTTGLDKTMKNIFPFWSWMRNNTVFQLKRLAEVPGQRMGIIRGFDAIEKFVPQMLGVDPLNEQERQALPDFMREGIKVPFWRGADGNSSVFYNLDLPIGEWNETIGGGAIRTMQKIASRLHPSVKAVLEVMADKDFFFGTPLTSETVNLETGERLRPVDRMKGLPLSISNLPGFGKDISAGEEVLTMNPYLRKTLEATGLSRALLSEPRKLFELAQSEGGAAKGKKLLDVLGGFKQKPIDLQRSQIEKSIRTERQKQELLEALRSKQIRFQKMDEQKRRQLMEALNQ